MNMREEIDSLKKERNVFISMALTFLFILVMVLIFSSNIRENKNICYDYVGLNETLEEIHNNCGSTFITQKWNDDNWFIFDSSKRNVIYHKLEDCLN